MTETSTPPVVPSRLGIGPMSRHVVEAVVRAAYRHDARLMLVASRGQIDAEELGGGYVENWSTETYTQFVRSIDPDRRVVLCRDHGGPWQRQAEVEKGYNEAEAMAASLESFRCDIDSGMTLLHIDVCKDANGPAEFHAALKRLVTLYGECHDHARAAGREIAFEVGLELQDASIDDPRNFAESLSGILTELRRESLPAPVFVVAQTGTKVVGKWNTGDFQGHESQIEAVRAMARTCRTHGAALKAHNADYLSGAQMSGLVSAGIGAVNIAPEFGVVETQAILKWLGDNGLRAERDAFLELALASGQWGKWFPDGKGSDEDKAVVAGHYVLATAEFQELKGRLDRADRGLDTAISAALAARLDRYVAWLGLR